MLKYDEYLVQYRHHEDTFKRMVERAVRFVTWEEWYAELGGDKRVVGLWPDLCSGCFGCAAIAALLPRVSSPMQAE